MTPPTVGTISARKRAAGDATDSAQPSGEAKDKRRRVEPDAAAGDTTADPDTIELLTPSLPEAKVRSDECICGGNLQPR